jgi:hypothetical protein
MKHCGFPCFAKGPDSEIIVGPEDGCSLPCQAKGSDSEVIVGVGHEGTHGEYVDDLAKEQTATTTASSAAEREGQRSRLTFSPRRESLQGTSSGANQLDWLNYIVKELWPFVEAAVEKMLREDILPEVEKDLPSVLRPLEASDFNLGTKTPELGPLIVYNTNDDEDKGVEINLGINTELETKIKLKAGSFSVGINALHVKGTVCVVMNPLIKKMPIVGGLQVYFINPPFIDFDFAGAGNVVDLPLINGSIRKVMNDIILQMMVLPNLMYIPLTPDPKVDLDLTAMNSPQPKGMLCLRVNGCKNLHASDWSITGKPNSDPYVVLTLADDKQETEVVKKNVNPTWKNAYFEFLVYNFHQQVRIEVFDHDMIQVGSPDLLAKMEVSVRDLIKHQSSVRKFDTTELEKSQKLKKPLESTIDLNASFKSFDDAAPFRQPQGPETVAMVMVKLHGARGLPPEFTAGTTVDLTVAGTTLKSPEAKYEPGGVATGFSEEMQRLVAHLQDSQRMSGQSLDAKKIAELSGLSVEAVETLTEVAHCNTCLWFKSFNFPIKDPAKVKTLKMKLYLDDAGLMSSQTTGEAEVDISELAKTEGRHAEKEVFIRMGKINAYVDVEIDFVALVLGEVPGDMRHTQ